MKLLFENWRQFLTEEKASDSLENWKHEDAKKYAQELIDDYGKPDVVTDNMFLWNDRISKFKQTFVKDESIEHCCPKPHRDYVYSTMIIDVPEDKMQAIADASESIIVDQLKNEVTARCADIFANAITLGFVQKLVAGDIKPEDSKEEYEKHILNGMLPDWFKEGNKENLDESLYYGTSTVFHKEIIKNGIKSPSKWGNYGFAEENAMKIVEKHGGEPAVIQILLSEFKDEHFLLDESNNDVIIYTEDLHIFMEKQEKKLV